MHFIYFMNVSACAAHHSHLDLRRFQNGKMYLSIYPGLAISYAFEFTYEVSLELFHRSFFVFCCCLIKLRRTTHLLTYFSTHSQDLIYTFFSIYASGLKPTHASQYLLHWKKWIEKEEMDKKIVCWRWYAETDYLYHHQDKESP